MSATEIALARAADDRMHVYEVLDDGTSLTPVCGASLTAVDPGTDDTLVCEACLPHLAEWACPEDPDAVFGLSEPTP